MTSTSPVLTSVSGAESSTGSLDVRSLSAELDSARIRWSEAEIGSYRLSIAEDRNYWTKGCGWRVTVSKSVVTESEVDPASTSGQCRPIEWTVEQLHQTISGWLDDADVRSGPEFGEHTLTARFNDVGVPVAMEFDLANGNDEESSIRVTFTPIP